MNRFRTLTLALLGTLAIAPSAFAQDGTDTSGKDGTLRGVFGRMSALGVKTDEFLSRLATARRSLATATATATATAIATATNRAIAKA